jgi:methyl-accepting chemotaxis protein
MSTIKFKTKLISFAIIIGLLPLTVLGVIAYSRSATALENSIYRSNGVYLENAIINIDNYFFERSGDAEILSSTDNIQEMITGEESMGTNIAFLSNVTETYNYSFIMVTDHKGVIKASNEKALIGVDLSMREYFQRAIKGEGNWSDLFYSDLIKTNAMVFAYPIRKEGEIIGTLGIAIDQKVINRLIHDGITSLGQSGDAYIVDEDFLLYSETVLGDYVKDAALKHSVESEGTKMLSEALKKNDTNFRSVGTYDDYLDSPVLGALGIVNVGEEQLGLVIEVDVAEAMVPVIKLRKLMMILGGVISILSLLVTLSLIQVLVDPIKKINAMLRDISEGEGDLTKQLIVKSKDEFGEMAELFNVFLNNLRTLISDVKGQATSLSNATTEISATVDESTKSLEIINHKANEISDNISSNASVTEETNASVEESATSSTLMSEKAKVVAENSVEVLKATQQGSQRLAKAKESVEVVEQLSENMETVIIGLNNSIGKIGDIVSVITNISEQVNLLALNAAIEAARAGEHGRGFAVVAEEVRKLADESRSSAEDITVLINGIVSQSTHALKSVEEEKKQVLVSVDNINETDMEMSNIVTLVNNVTANIEMITQMIDNQSLMTQDISKAMDQITESSVEGAESIEDITTNIQTQSASLEEISASMEELNTTADKLHHEMSKFIV